MTSLSTRSLYIYIELKPFVFVSPSLLCPRFLFFYCHMNRFVGKVEIQCLIKKLYNSRERIIYSSLYMTNDITIGVDEYFLLFTRITFVFPLQSKKYFEMTRVK